MNRIVQIATSARQMRSNRIHLLLENARLSSITFRSVQFIPASCIHSSSPRCRKSIEELTSEPTRFTSSPANSRSMPSLPERNVYQPLIVAGSLFVFVLYFLLLREENDLDEELNMGLFDRVPQLEEPHLIQAIPRMQDAGVDTKEAELRLKELREIRQAKESKAKQG